MRGGRAALDKRIVNSEGATVSCQQSQFVAGNSAGFSTADPSSRHYLSCAVIAGEDDVMQRDDWIRRRARPRPRRPRRSATTPAPRALAAAQPQAFHRAARAVRGAGRERPAAALRSA